jgi:hypothetical protein
VIESPRHAAPVPHCAARRRLLAGAIAALLAGAAIGTANAQATETQVKAAYLYKFLAFVEWPLQTFTRPDSPIVIGVLGGQAISEELALLTAGRQVEGRPVQVRRLSSDTVPADVHVLFVGADAADRLGKLAAASKDRPLLIVSESQEGLLHGGAINFVLAEDRVRFEVALQPIESRGLRVSARLLAVAHRVKANPL